MGDVGSTAEEPMVYLTHRWRKQSGANSSQKWDSRPILAFKGTGNRRSKADLRAGRRQLSDCET